MPEAITESLIKTCNSMLNDNCIDPGFQEAVACLLWPEAFLKTSFHGTRVGLQRMGLGAREPSRWKWKITLVKGDLPGMNGGCVLAVVGNLISCMGQAAGGGVGPGARPETRPEVMGMAPLQFLKGGVLPSTCFKSQLPKDY